MGKKKVALFYDTSTEAGKKIMDFLTPFAKRKSDIVGELILLWIDEHGATVPVEWVAPRKAGELMRENRSTVSFQTGETKSKASHAETKEMVYATVSDGEAVEKKHDKSMIKAGLASFM